jgi:hypothetical protein
MRSLAYVLLGFLSVGCGSSSNNGGMDMAMAPTTLGAPPMLAVACTDTMADVYTLPTGLNYF